MKLLTALLATTSLIAGCADNDTDGSVLKDGPDDGRRTTKGR